MRFDDDGRLVYDGRQELEEHTRVCPQNPANKFACRHCGNTFQNFFNNGRLTLDGQALRADHERDCLKHPARSATCEHCLRTFVVDSFCVDARDQLAKHVRVCGKNPSNTFSCEHCAKCFVHGYNLDGRLSLDGRIHRDEHSLVCPKRCKPVTLLGQECNLTAAKIKASSNIKVQSFPIRHGSVDMSGPSA